MVGERAVLMKKTAGRLKLRLTVVLGIGHYKVRLPASARLVRRPSDLRVLPTGHHGQLKCELSESFRTIMAN